MSGCTRPRSRLFSTFKTLTLLSGTLIPHPRLVLFNSHGHSKSNVDTGAIAALAHNVKADTRRANKASRLLLSRNYRGEKTNIVKKKRFAKKVKRVFPQAVFLSPIICLTGTGSHRYTGRTSLMITDSVLSAKS